MREREGEGAIGTRVTILCSRSQSCIESHLESGPEPELANLNQEYACLIL